MMNKKPRRLEQHSHSLLCRICGDIARGMNFSVVSCMSCKMFFRRHAQSDFLRYPCYSDGTCTITRKTRRFCASCRLKRCFEEGMDRQLIRPSLEQNKKNQLPKPTTLSLLDNDRSTLTLDEWNLLSNIVNTYDEQKLLIRSKDFLKKHFSLPAKIRLKDSNTLNYIGILYSTMYTFIQRCPLYSALPSDIRTTLIKRNFSAVGAFNGVYLVKEMNIFENEAYSNIIDNIYGSGYSNSVIQASRRLQENGTLIKIMLMIIIFSSNSTVIIKDHTNDDTQIICNPIMLMNNIENILVTMLWKYLIYQYGFNEAVLRFLSLVKSILDIIQRMDERSNAYKHWTMVENVIEQITYSLRLSDS